MKFLENKNKKGNNNNSNECIKIYKKLKEVHPEIIRISNYINCYIPLLCKDKYGEILLNTRFHIIKANKPTIKCAVDKVLYWRNLVKDIRGDKYDYSKSIYKGKGVKVIIICKIHGEFYQTPNDHLSKKSGCSKCGNISQSKIKTKTTLEFIRDANIIHNNKYDYSETKYINVKTIVTIICPLHGKFLCSPYSHLNTSGCRKCGKEILRGMYNITVVKRNLNKYKQIKMYVYIFKCHKNTEEFYKIGITKNIDTRMYQIPYYCELLYKLNTNLLNAVFIENHILNKLFKYRYNPKIEFKGYTECFTTIKSLNLSKYEKTSL